MRLCIECRFFSAPNMCNREVVLDQTRRKEESRISPVDGSEIPFASSKPTFSALVYRTSGDCGMEAKFFEQKK